MSDIERLQLLTKQMHLEPAEDCHLDPLPSGGREAITVKNAIMPNGRRIKLLKTLLSSYCEKNCLYCPFRAQRDMPRAAFTPDDFAHLFDSLYRSGFVEGIFLSSSVFNGAIKTQDKLLDTATILRKKYQFKGYLHLKIMPGAEKAQVERAMLIADRLSVNLEAPHSKALAVLAPQKDMATDLLAPLKWIQEIRSKKSPSRAWKGKWPSSTTQFVVGAAGETDLDILSTTAFCWYDNNNIMYGDTYGALYNWYSINTNKLSPVGWHIPTDEEWNTLINFLGGEDVAGGKLKESGNTHWNIPNEGADNSSGFTALPGGSRSDLFHSLGDGGRWWSSTQFDDTNAWALSIGYTYANASRYNFTKNHGYSVRCIRD